TSGVAKPGYWGESLLALSPTLKLKGVYTPFNYCALETSDGDLGSGAPLFFDIDPSVTTTPHLVAFGSKQGNVYLVDRDHLSTNVVQRPACAVVDAGAGACNKVVTDPASDTSLLPPDPQPQFGERGTLNAFGPYSECAINVNYAKMRTTPAL